MRKASVRSALSLHASQSGLLALDMFDTTSISTKNALGVLTNLKLERSVLVVVDSSVPTTKSYRNIPFVDVVDAAFVNVSHLLKARKVLFVGGALDKVIEQNRKTNI